MLLQRLQCSCLPCCVLQLMMLPQQRSLLPTATARTHACACSCASLRPARARPGPSILSPLLEAFLACDLVEAGHCDEAHGHKAEEPQQHAPHDGACSPGYAPAIRIALQLEEFPPC